MAVLLGGAAFGCHDATVPGGGRGPTVPEPRAGQYVVAEFKFQNNCSEPAFALSDVAATARSAEFSLNPDADHQGTVELAGTLQVAHPIPGTPDVAIFDGPDTGRYTISGDTLRLWFPKKVNEWVGVLRFPRYQAGQIAGSSRSNCSAISLRLEKRP
ncbi:MAG: hypothetical protein OEY20_10585 [Gemmatimonadota bacterium]|nr:hypothetical protein [Gemmatimonadota bacterium]MDH5197689.1 hypothetical protein [Gemmatimonadota bacterium]